MLFFKTLGWLFLFYAAISGSDACSSTSCVTGNGICASDGTASCLCFNGFDGNDCANTTTTYPTCSNGGSVRLSRSQLLSGLEGAYYKEVFGTGAPSINPQSVIYQNIDNLTSFDLMQEVMWQGYVVGALTGNYTFSFTVDEGVKITLNENLILSAFNVTDGVTTYTTESVYLEADIYYFIEIYYFNFDSTGFASLSWTDPSGYSEIIPIDALFHLEFCNCPTSFYGSLCEISSPVPCEEVIEAGVIWGRTASGTTANGACPFGYNGSLRRTCTNGVFGAISGTNCAAVSLEPVTCQHGGSPLLENQGYTCLCPVGYSGDLCQNTTASNCKIFQKENEIHEKISK